MSRVKLEILTGPDQMVDGDGWEHYAYTVRLRFEGRKMDSPYRMGLAHSSDPTAREVLECMFSDAASVDAARSFEEWAGDYGYDVDSRKAEALYETCEKQTRRLKRLLGLDEHATGPWMEADPEKLARAYGEEV